MPFPMELTDIESAIAKCQLTEKKYDSQEYYILKTGLSLICSINDFIEHVENNDNVTVGSKEDWLKFKHLYQSKLKTSNDVFLRYLKRFSITSVDFRKIMNIIDWAVSIMKSALQENHDKPLNIVEVILAGKFYTSFHYYNYKINEAFDMKVSFPNSVRTKKNLSLVLKERAWIEETYKSILQQEDDHFSEGLKSKLFALYDRTVGFLEALEIEFKEPASTPH